MMTHELPDNVIGQAQMLSYYLGLPNQRARYGIDWTAAIQTRLAQLMTSVTPEEALPELYAEVLVVKSILAEGV